MRNRYYLYGVRGLRELHSNGAIRLHHLYCKQENSMGGKNHEENYMRSLEEDKAFWVNKEASSSIYVAAVNEEPVIPEYDYMTIANTIDEIDRKIVTIKHTLNLTNATAKVPVGNQEMSIDSILIRMAQLNKRKAVLDDMRKRLPKMRVYSNSFSSSGSVPEYKYINYDLEVIRQEYDRISNTIMEMQIALDRYNQTVLFDVDI